MPAPPETVLGTRPFKIHGPPCRAVRRHGQKAPVRPGKCRLVKRLPLVNSVKQKVKSNNTPIAPQRLSSDIAGIVPVGQVDARRPTDLPGDVIQPRERPGGNADGTLHLDARLEQRIQHTAGINAAKRAALQHHAARRQRPGILPRRQCRHAGICLFLHPAPPFLRAICRPFLFTIAHFSPPRYPFCRAGLDRTISGHSLEWKKEAQS